MIRFFVNEVSGKIFVEGNIKDLNFKRTKEGEVFYGEINKEILEACHLAVQAHDQFSAMYEHGYDDWRKKRED